MRLFFRTTCGLYFPKPLPLYPQHGSSPETVIYNSFKKYLAQKNTSPKIYLLSKIIKPTLCTSFKTY